MNTHLLSAVLLTIFNIGAQAQNDSCAGAKFSEGPNLTVPRMAAIQKTLPDGKVLLVGGHGTGFTTLNTAELYDQNANLFNISSTNYYHDGGAFVQLSPFKYLIVGGAADLGVAPGYQGGEIYNRNNNTFTVTGSMNIPRTAHSGAFLKGGKVLIVGGWYNPSGASQPEVYDTTTQTFSVTTYLLNTPRSYNYVIPTNDGGAIVLGGISTYGSTNIEQVEYYDAVKDSFGILQNELIQGETGWYVYSGNFNGEISDQQLSNGKYVLSAYNSTSNCLITIDPQTKVIEKLIIDTAYSNIPVLHQPIVDKEKNRLYIFSYVPNTDPVETKLYTIDLTEDSLYKPTCTYTFINGWYMSGTTFNVLKDGRILMTGGHSQTGYNTNFSPVSTTLFLDPSVPFVTSVNKLLSTRSKTIVYPNPSSSTLFIDTRLDNNDKIKFDIYNFSGAKMFEFDASLTKGRNVIACDIERLKAGQYIIKINAGGASETHKFIVVK